MDSHVKPHNSLPSSVLAKQELWPLLRQVSFSVMVTGAIWVLNSLIKARMHFRRLKKQGIPILRHSFVFGHLPILVSFYSEWASDVNFTQTFGLYVSKNWRRFFPTETQRPPLIYLDVWPLCRPMIFSLEASISNQMAFSKPNIHKSPMQGPSLNLCLRVPPPLLLAASNCKKRTISRAYNGWERHELHCRSRPSGRNGAASGFSQSNINALMPQVLDEVIVFVDVLQGLVGKDGSFGPVFSLEEKAFNLAHDITARSAMGARLHMQSQEPNRFSILYKEQLDRMELTLKPLKLRYRATPMFKSLIKRKRDELMELARPMILENMKKAPDGGTLTLVQAAAKEYLKDESGGDENAFVSHLFLELMMMFFGGEDAVSIIVPWLFRYLQDNPSCLAKLRDEHDSVLGTNPDEAEQRIREGHRVLNKLSYTLVVVKESLRLCPPAITLREGSPEFKFQVHGFDASWPPYWPTKNHDLFDSPRVIHTDPRLFPRPLEFLPERYLVPEGHELHPPPNTWRAFQLGPRKCIGYELALVQIKLLLVLVVQRYEIASDWDEWNALLEQRGEKAERKMVEGERMYTTGKATSHPKDGCPVHVRVIRRDEMG